MPRKIKINKGDSWIKIANDNNLSLNDLLYWNGVDPMSREALPRINPGQEIYVSDPYRLSASSITTDAPTDYSDYGEAGKQLINNYALAVQQGAISLDNVPEAYRTAVYQRGITNATNKAANTTLKVGLNLGAFLLDPVGYTLSTVGQKGIAYTTDRTSGRNEYGTEDALGYTPIKGRQYASEHPAEAALIDAGAGIASGSLLRNLPNFIRGLGQNWRAMMQNAVASTGQQRQTMMYPGKDTFETVYTSGTKGVGKTGTVRAGRVGGYSPNTSAKGVFNNQSSGNAITWVSPDKTIPMLPLTPIPLSPVVGPINWMNRRDPKVVVNNPEQHIYEQQSFNRWQLPMPAGGMMGEFKPGTGNFVLTGHAPIGNSVDQQALTNESIRVYNNDYAPRISTYVNGNIEGTPSNIHSGLGIIWGSENPGNLIIK